MPATCSVIINTYNRADYLRKLLPGLSHLTGVDFEVVVVNGPSDDDTDLVLGQYKGKIKVANCPQRNLSISRNIGIAQAAGDVVVFIDDDALPADTLWLKRFVDAFEAYPQLGAAGGKVLQADSDQMEFDGGATTQYGFQRFDGKHYHCETPDRTPWILRVAGGNCAFLNKYLRAVGGYDEHFIYYLDETDVCMRLHEAGLHTRHLPENAIRHYPARISAGRKETCKKNRVIAQSDTYFAIKNARDSWPSRIIKTLRFATKKHFFIEIRQQRDHGTLSRWQYYKVRWHWLTGVVSGLIRGCLSPRKLAHFSHPPPFLSFRPVYPERKLSVAFLSQRLPMHHNYGGISRYICDLAVGMHARGHEVHLITQMDEPATIHRHLDFAIHGIPPAEHTNATLWDDSPILNKNTSYSIAVAKQLESLIQQGIHIDVVHAANWDQEGAATIRALQIPVILMLVTSLAQDVIEMGWEWNADMQACVALDYWQIMNAALVCAPSKGVLKSYREIMELPEATLDQVSLMPLGIVRDTETTKRTDLSKNILFVGRCEPRKGIDTLLDVLPAILTQHQEWICYIVGNDQIPGPDGATYKNAFLGKHAGSSWLNRVVFRGFVSEDDLRLYYRNCDIFAAPSSFESFGLIYLEAMQYAKPVIGCRTGGVAETVGPDAGILIEPGNRGGLKEALETLILNESLRLSMGECGRERVRTQMNHHVMAKTFESFCNRVVHDGDRDSGHDHASKQVNIRKPLEMRTAITSFPKSGRTWLSFLVANYLNLRYQMIPEVNFETVYRIIPSDGAPIEPLDKIKRSQIPVFYATHGDPGNVSADRIIRLVRNPYDVLVSFYFHLTRHWVQFHGSLSEFLRDEKWGCQCYKRYHDELAEMKGCPILDISYEDMHDRTAEVLGNVLRFGSNDPVEESLLHEAISRSTFERLRNVERTGPSIPDHQYDRLDQHASRARIGTVGSSRRFLSQEDADFISTSLNIPPIRCEQANA